MLVCAPCVIRGNSTGATNSSGDGRPSARVRFGSLSDIELKLPEVCSLQKADIRSVNNVASDECIVGRPWASMSACLQAIVSFCDPDNALAGVTSLRSIFWISIDRSAALVVNSFVASCAVLRFEPNTAMPPSNAAMAAAIAPGSNLIAPKSMPVNTQAPPATIILEAKINLRQLSIFPVSCSIRSSMRAISSCKLLPRSLSKFKLAFPSPLAPFGPF
jgi:hypothetical protein